MVIDARTASVLKDPATVEPAGCSADDRARRMRADHEIIGNLYRPSGVKVDWRPVPAGGQRYGEDGFPYRHEDSRAAEAGAAGPCDEGEVPVDGHTAYAADGTACPDNCFRASAASALS